MKKKTQKDAVFEIVKELLGNQYSPNLDMRPFFGSRDNRAGQVYDDTISSRELMNQAVSLFIEKIKKEEIKKPKSRTGNNGHLDLKWYARNTIYNWLRKDKRLNGGIPVRKFDEIAVELELKKVLDSANHPNFKKITSNKAINECFNLLHSGNLDYKEFLYTKNHIIAQILETLENTQIKKAS